RWVLQVRGLHDQLALEAGGDLRHGSLGLKEGWECEDKDGGKDAFHEIPGRWEKSGDINDFKGRGGETPWPEACVSTGEARASHGQRLTRADDGLVRYNRSNR